MEHDRTQRTRRRHKLQNRLNMKRKRDNNLVGRRPNNNSNRWKLAIQSLLLRLSVNLQLTKALVCA